ncbi:MAG TPA: acylphosphatase, partial [Spirochaetota bacterium]|nr:acylphosphatase [Spirochaetota bacterium]
GFVQGVGYRYFVTMAAGRLGIRGFVKNLFNGDVEVYAIGEETKHKELLKRLKAGPSHSRVREVIIENRPVLDRYTSFIVEF